MITDRQHLMRVAESGIEAIEALGRAWLHEDQAACAPHSSSIGPISGGTPSDPVMATACDSEGTVDLAKYRDRDRLGSQLLTLVGRLNEVVVARRPRQAGGPCSCCDTETATHGSDRHGRPVECWACWRYRRTNGTRCTDVVHQDRPRVVMCECPPECCPVCDQRATDGRLSDGCRQRLSRARTA